MDSLAANPSGGSSIYGQPSQNPDMTGTALDLVSRLKDREMRDFKDKANFMADLSVKQSRIRNILSPSPGGDIYQDGQTGPKNTVMGQDPNQMTGYQKGELGIRQQGLNLESQRLGQQGQLGQKALDIRTAQEKLNQQKSDQINAQKTADMERKIHEADARIQQAQEALKSRNTNSANLIKSHEALSKAVEERHKLELAQKDLQFAETQRLQNATIDKMKEDAKAKGRSKTTTEINPDGTKKTVTTEKGDAADTIQVIGKDGKTYTIPKDKEDDWNQNHKGDEPEGQDNEEPE